MDQLNRAGIVDEVKAQRRKGEVVNLQATIRFETDLQSDYDYDSKLQIDKIYITFPPGAGINPGDLVVLDMVVQSPELGRFLPALEVGTMEIPDPDNEDPETGAM